MDNLTLKEYELRMKAYSLHTLDEEYKAHKQAWINHQVKATKQIGKKTVPVYKKFEQFFDFKKLEQNILGTQKIESVSDKEFKRLIREYNS